MAVDTPVTLTLTLTVTGTGTIATDGTSDTVTDTLDITVLGYNRAPTASMSATPTTVGGGDIVTLDGTAADADNDTLTYAWASSGGGTFGNASLLDTDWEAPTVIGKMVVTLTLTVSDGIVDTVVRQDITVVPIAPRITPQPFRDALISQWRSGSIAPQLIDIMLTATDRLYIANVNLLLRGLDIDALPGVLLDYAGYRFGVRRPLVDAGPANGYFGFDGTGATPVTGSFDEAPFFSAAAFSDTKAPLADRYFRGLVKLAAFNKIGVKTNAKCLGALQTVYPDGYIQDNGDLSMTFFIDDSVMMLSAVITQMKLWPKPAGIAAVIMGLQPLQTVWVQTRTGFVAESETDEIIRIQP